MADMKYQPTWESIDARPVPAWFEDAKFGIFIHYGLYSVPAWAKKGEYSEWYWECMAKRGELWDRHVRVWGEDFAYQDFVRHFNCEFYDADHWADLFQRSGARYVVPTSKHHDGFCLWPSRFAWNWNSMDVGPHRDLLGELMTAVRSKGMKAGFYYSLYEWYNATYLHSVDEYVDTHMIPQMKEVIEAYDPAILFTDGEWDHPWQTWRSPEFLAWLFNEPPCRDEIVVNDRWGTNTRSEHGGYYTTEYGEVGEGKKLTEGRPWEECRGIGASFAYSRREMLDEYLSERDLIHLLVDMVSRGGNLLLNVGPTADGLIPTIMEERLLQIGEWLRVNGEGIYGTRKWKSASDPTSDFVRYTTKDGIVYATCLRWPGDELVLSVPSEAGTPRVTMLGHATPLGCAFRDGNLRINIPHLSVNDVPCSSAWTLRIEGVA
jgi:alpha-L-fucosidase